MIIVNHPLGNYYVPGIFRYIVSVNLERWEIWNVEWAGNSKYEAQDHTADPGFELWPFRLKSLESFKCTTLTI